MARSIPIEKAMDDALVVWAQNGEPLRPEQGFPMRLLLPGWEGNTNVKWLSPPRARHSAVDDALGDRDIHGSARERHRSTVQLRDGCEIHHHVAGASGNDRTRLAAD